MKTKYNSTLSSAAAESGGQTQSKSIRSKCPVLALGGFLFTTIFALSAAPVEAQCQRWDVSGKWKIRQGSFTLPVVLSQNGRTISGSALQRDAILEPSSGPLGIGGFAATGDLAGSVSGTVDGDSFDVQIDWSRGGKGVYRGTIGKSGVIQGMTYDKNKPSSTATWRSSKAMKCADEDVDNPAESPSEVQPNPTPKVLKSTGKKPTEPTPKVLTSTGRKPAATPTISAHPVSITIPEGQTEGTVTLTWDSGPDHPDARPWLKEGMQGKEVMVADQGKGTRPVKVERAKNYQFLLKDDAGQQLARAVVISGR